MIHNRRNATEAAAPSEDEHRTAISQSPVPGVHLGVRELRPLMWAFISQLRLMLGLPELSPSTDRSLDSAVVLLPSPQGLAGRLPFLSCFLLVLLRSFFLAFSFFFLLFFFYNLLFIL